MNPIIDTALLAASEVALMPALVKNWNASSSTPRIWAAYTGGTVQTIAESTDMAAQTFTPAAAGTLTPAVHGLSYFLTDRRIPSGLSVEQARKEGFSPVSARIEAPARASYFQPRQTIVELVADRATRRHRRPTSRRRPPRRRPARS